MTEIWGLAALWLGLALFAALLSIWLKVANALSEIAVGTVAQLVLGAAFGAAFLGADHLWVKFLAGTGAIVLTFLAGAELDPEVFRRRWKEATAVGLISFFAPFFGCAAAARWGLGWSAEASWLAGVAMSTTSVAVVYAVMIEFGFNTTEYGKTVLAACFITDLGTVIALGLIFAPFTLKTALFVGGLTAAALALPWLTPLFFRRFGGRPSELETKFLLLFLFGLGALAGWADSEAVLPAYVLGMMLAGTVGKDHVLVRRLRTLTFGLLTPFYFIRAGSFVSVPALIAAPGAFLLMLAVKVVTKISPDARRQGGDQDCRRLSRNPGIPVAVQGRNVYDTADVDRPDLRDHLLAVRPVARHRHPGTVLGSGCGCDSERRGADTDR